MKKMRIVLSLLGFGLAASLLSPVSAFAASEESFDVLKLGTHTYKNVTVTTKQKDYIFIMHSEGMSNIKVSELTPDLREMLGYNAAALAAENERKAKSVPAWARQAMAKVDLPQLKLLGASIMHPGGEMNFRSFLHSSLFLPVLVIISLSYLLFCYCCQLICRKTDNDPGMAIWLPVLQIFPLLKAANMRAGWFFVFLIPVLNVVALITWSVNISQARGKSGWVALWLLLPLTNLLAFLYLAFSATPRKANRPAHRVEIMTLETA
jgi:hypothetical protein